MKIYNSISDLIGNTPILLANNFMKEINAKANIFLKLECFNPQGSAKDRPAKEMIEEAERNGLIKEGTTIIEPTSGNTGISLAAIAVSKGYKCIIVMPDTMSTERRNLMRAYGADVVLTDGKLGMAGAIDEAKRLNQKIENSFIPDQFNNSNNPRAHYKTTGPEIFRDTDGMVDIFVATVGTGGTLSGTAKYLKNQKNNIKIVAVEPKSSPLISKGYSGAHKIQGIGANFIPNTLDTEIIDEIITVSDDDAYKYARMFTLSEGVFVGISSGAALKAVFELAILPENAGKNIVAVLTDSGERYLSTPNFI